jgi:hypothetical protein
LTSFAERIDNPVDTPPLKAIAMVLFEKEMIRGVRG